VPRGPGRSSRGVRRAIPSGRSYEPFTLVLLTGSLLAQPAVDTALKNLKFRSIGPAMMGGRDDDFAVESDPRVIYVGAAARSIFKTVNGGTTWTPIFDDQYVGNNRQSSS
jgi:hypothetical protein